MPSCSNCGFEDFFEDVGAFFCKRCQTQLQGMSQEETALEDVMAIQLRTKVKASAEKVKKRTEGYAWNSYEAFDLIIKEQARFLVEELKLPEELRKQILSVWSLFLQKSEIVMKDGIVDQEKSKLPLMSRWRDIAIIANRFNIVPSRQPGKKPIDWTDEDGSDMSSDGSLFTPVKKRVRSGKRALVPEGFQGSSRKKVLFSSRTKRILSREFLWTSSSSSEDECSDKHTSSSQSLSGEPRQALEIEDVNIEQLAVTDKDEETMETDVVDSTVAVKEEVHPDTSLNFTSFSLDPLNLLEVDFSQGFENRPKPKLFYDKLNEYSKEVVHRRGLNPDKELTSQRNYPSKTVKVGNPVFRDTITLTTSIAIIYIALRYSNLDIFISDLLTWIDQGHLLYYSSCSIFPSDWIVFEPEIYSFRPTTAPCPKNLLARAADLVTFLGCEFDSQTRISMKNLIVKYLRELNLPSDLMTVMESVPRFESKLMELERMTSLERKKQLPFFECNAIAIIIIFLKKIFGLTKQSISEICNELRQENVFLFDEWLDYSHVRLNCLKSQVTPLYGVPITEVTDYDIIVKDFIHRVKPRSEIRFGIAPETTLPDVFSDELDYSLRMIRSGPSQEPDSKPSGRSPFFKPTFPSSFLTDATTFCIERLKDNRSVTKILSKDFTELSISTELHDNTQHDPLAGIQLKHREGSSDNKQCKDLLLSFPPALTLLLSYASLILHTPDYMIIPDLLRMDKFLSRSSAKSKPTDH